MALSGRVMDILQARAPRHPLNIQARRSTIKEPVQRHRHITHVSFVFVVNWAVLSTCLALFCQRRVDVPAIRPNVSQIFTISFKNA